MTKYVSCTCTSIPSVATMSPVNPPVVNSKIKPRAYNIGASKRIDPLCKLTVQLNTLIAEGTATKNVSSEKTTPA